MIFPLKFKFKLCTIFDDASMYMHDMFDDICSGLLRQTLTLQKVGSNIVKCFLRPSKESINIRIIYKSREVPATNPQSASCR